MNAAGIHSVLVGFILGACMPRGKRTEEIKRKISPITILLVPVFFTYSGLNTRLDTVNSLTLLALALGILLVSVAAKFGACWLTARPAGEDHRPELGISSEERRVGTGWVST